jgi:hypothetical protein
LQNQFPFGLTVLLLLSGLDVSFNVHPHDPRSNGARDSPPGIGLSRPFFPVEDATVWRQRRILERLSYANGWHLPMSIADGSIS